MTTTVSPSSTVMDSSERMAQSGSSPSTVSAKVSLPCPVFVTLKPTETMMSRQVSESSVSTSTSTPSTRTWTIMATPSVVTPSEEVALSARV